MTPPDRSPQNLTYAWYVVAVLMIAYTLSFIDRQILSLMVGPIRADLQISDTGFGLLSGFAFALFYTVMGIPLGRFADNHNRSKLIVVGILFWSVMTAACGLARTFWQLFLARMGVGVGEAALSPAAYSLIADYFPKELLGRAISLYGTGIYFGAGLAFIVGGVVVDIVSSAPPVSLPIIGSLRPWQTVFFIVGLPGVFVALLALTIREPERLGRKLSNDRIPFAEVLKYLMERWKTYLPYFFGISFVSVYTYGVLVWFPEFIRRTYGWPIGDIGVLAGVIILFFGTTGILAGGIVADRFTRRGHPDAHLRAVLIGSVCLAPFAILFPLMPSAEFAFTLFAGHTFFAGYHYGIIPSGLQIVTPNRMRGQVSAIYLFVNNIIGLGFGPLLIGLFTDYVYRDDAKIYLSLTSTAALSVPLAIVLFAYGMKYYRRSIEELEAQTIV